MSKSANNVFLKKTVLASAVVTALSGAGLGSAEAVVYKFSFSGGDGNVFTMLNAGGGFTPNSDLNSCNPSMLSGNSCMRTAVSGSVTYDDVTDTGTMIIDPFSFFGSGPAAATTISIQAIGNGAGGPGNLMLGNMGFNWNTSSGIPVSIVWDATGFFSAISGGLSPGDSVTGGSLPESNNTTSGATTFPIGPAVMAVTSWNTTTVPGVDFYTNPSGTLPLVTDTVVDVTSGDTGVGGSPMPTAPFKGFNANFDFTNLLVTCVDSNCGQGIVTNTTPFDNSPVTATIAVTFSRRMTVSTVVGAITLVDVTNGNTPISVTVTPNTTAPNDATYSDRFTITFAVDQNATTPAVDLKYETQYRATVADTVVEDEDGTPLAASPDNTWTWTTSAAPQAQVCRSGEVGPAPEGSNFSMLDAAGRVFGGTNDIEYNFGNGLNAGHDPGVLNDSESGILGITTNYMASALPHPFFAAIWTAHHIRLFSEGSYVINTECTTGELEAGTCAPNIDDSKNLTMDVGSGQIGAHMLFDWNGNFDIDVVNVWDLDTTWNDTSLGDKNNLWTGARWIGPTGYTVHPQTIWGYVSTDADGDGEIGVKMIDGPFQKFSANFNLSPTFSCEATPPDPIFIGDSGQVSSGCSLGTGNANPVERGDWWLVAGFLAWLGLIRRRLARQQS